MRTTAAIVALIAVLGTACGDDDPGPELTAEPLPAPTTVAPTGPPSPTLDDSPSPSVSPTVSPTEAASRPPTDTDLARFVADHQPESSADLEHVAQDLDGDGVDEIVFGYVRTDRNVAHIDVAWWDGSTSYEVVFSSDGGPATNLDDLQVRDVNADGNTEIVTFQSAERSAASLSIWRVVAERQAEELRAAGGCYDGQHTYGVVGAELDDRDADGADEIYAPCEEAQLPPEAWPTHRYVWRDGAYRHEPSTIED